MENELICETATMASEVPVDNRFAWLKKTAISLVIFGAILCGLGGAGVYLVSSIQRVDLKLSKDSSLSLSADNYVNSITGTDNLLANIKSNGYNIYYNVDDNNNSWLNGKTAKLSGGGKLEPQKKWQFYVNVICSKIVA